MFALKLDKNKDAVSILVFSLHLSAGCNYCGFFFPQIAYSMPVEKILSS